MKKRLNITVLTGVTFLAIGVWFGFFLGTIYTTNLDEDGKERNSRETNGEIGTGCRCSSIEEEGESDLKNELEKASEGINELVIVDRRPVLSESIQSQSADTVPSMNLDKNPIKNITVEHHYDSYHLTWTTVDETLTTLFSAYYDDRPAMHGPAIVLPGYQAKKFRDQSLYCLFRYKDGSTKCSPRKTILMGMNDCDHEKEFVKKKERLFLHLFHVCTLTNSTELAIPSHVALSTSSNCSPSLSSSFIPIYIYRPKNKLKFGLCIQTPAFDKTAQEFASFIEFHRLQGVEIFTLYVMNIDHNTLSFLRKTYGGTNGILDIVKWTDHLHEKEPIHYYGEILANNDCLYRNMNKVKYLAFLDLDEAIVPRRYDNWGTMLEEIDQGYLDSFIFVNSIFMKTEQIDKTMLNNNQLLIADDKLCHDVQLPVYFTNYNKATCYFSYFSRSKLIVKPDLIMDTGIHGVCNRINNTTHYLVPTESALSQHYRSVPTIECRKDRKTRKYPTTLDYWMTRYANWLIPTLRQHFCK